MREKRPSKRQCFKEYLLGIWPLRRDRAEIDLGYGSGVGRCPEAVRQVYRHAPCWPLFLRDRYPQLSTPSDPNVDQCRQRRGIDPSTICFDIDVVNPPAVVAV